VFDLNLFFIKTFNDDASFPRSPHFPINSFKMTQPTLHDIDCVVIGAGAVGLAVARALALAGRQVMVLEQHGAIGTETSARNSEVVHAGLYYASGSLKAQLCVRGNALLKEYAARKGFALKTLGKLIVATDDSQLPALDALAAQAQANGVPQMLRLSAAQAMALEPQLHCVAALHSAGTGIVDSHAYMLALQGDIEAAGGSVVCHAAVTAGEITPQGSVIEVATPDGDLTLRTQWLINCAGLHAPALARRIHSFPAAHVPTAYFAKGSYYSLAGRSPFQRLIYPLPHNGGLGVHITLDLAGQARFGPDAQWLDIADASQIDYTVDAARAVSFYAQVRRYWRGLPDGALQPAYSGVRPKIVPAGAPAGDFIVSTPAQHGVAGVVNLFGIESPGLTASLALGDYVAGAL
jgi:L-2-hydroxyglutarate oxidase LhgO